MRLSRLFHSRKQRKYPIQRDQIGQSLRARCFALFAQGQRPAEVARELNMKETTVFRYFRDWKRVGNDFERQYAYVKELFKPNAPDRDKNLELVATSLGMEKEQFESILSQPYGLRRLLIGKFYFPRQAEADHKRHLALQLAIIFSDHLIKSGGKWSDVYWALQQLMKRNRILREQEDEEIEANNQVMTLIHKILEVDLENERRGRIEPDRLTEEERNAVMRLKIANIIKETEATYWVRKVRLMAEGLTPKQAREKIFQDVLDKGDLKQAKMMREFLDKVDPSDKGDQTPPQPSSPN